MADIQRLLKDHERRLLDHRGRINQFGDNQNALYDQLTEQGENIKQLMMFSVAIHAVLTHIGVDIPSIMAELGTTFKRITGDVKTEKLAPPPWLEMVQRRDYYLTDDRPKQLLLPPPSPPSPQQPPRARPEPTQLLLMPPSAPSPQPPQPLSVRVEEVDESEPSDTVPLAEFEQLRQQVGELQSNIVMMAQQMQEMSIVATQTASASHPQPAREAPPPPQRKVQKFAEKAAFIAIKNELAQSGEGQQMISDLSAKLAEFIDETRQHIFLIGGIVGYVVNLEVDGVKYEHVWVPNQLNEQFTEFMRASIEANDGEDFATAERIPFTAPDTPLRPLASTQFRKALPLYPFIECDADEQYYLVWSVNCRSALIRRLLTESLLEDPFELFIGSAAQLRTVLLKLARVLIRYPDDKNKPPPQCIMWRDHILANWLPDETIDTQFPLTLRAIVNDDTTLT
jgi:hypothetical protein